MARVEINDDNIRHCRCPQCPVQANSQCAKDALTKYNNESKADSFDASKAALIYCATGKSFCTDLDGSQNCMCPSCLVWDEYDLQSMKYCLNGDADEIG